MSILVGLENNYEGRSLAWALDYPGCFTYGSDGEAALAGIPAAFARYRAWIAAHTPDSWLANADEHEACLSEVWDVYSLDNAYRRVETGGKTVNAWFSSDWFPLASHDIQRGLRLLEFSRLDLLALRSGLGDEALDRKLPDERWSLRGIFRHVANAEYWYLDRLDLAGIQATDLPEDVFERLGKVRKRMVETLPQLESAERVRGKGGEWWSPRKMLRRAVEHELDHVDHIRKLINQ